MNTPSTSLRGSRRAVAPFRVLAAVSGSFGLVLVATAALKPIKHKWELPHSEAETFLSNRPECPENWSTIRLWPDSFVMKLIAQRAQRPGITLSGGAAFYHPPGGDLPLSGPQTNIPEFNDCQKLLMLSDPTRFDSLTAIFAAFQVDTATAHLGWHTLNWSSSNAAVATVSASGRVTAVAAGNATITARSESNQSLKLGVAIQVMPGPIPATTLPPIRVASTPVDTMMVGTSRQAIAEFGDPVQNTRAVATIFNYGPGYPTLGIGPNFSCLYLYFDASHRLSARVVQVDILTSSSTLCSDPLVLNSPLGKRLEVRRTVVDIPASNQAGLYPAVARWDWDPSTQKQFIGIACGAAWCEVGEPPFNPPPPVAVPAATSAAERKVMQIKGWHDQQILAVMKTRDAPPVPSNLLGTVIPNPRLKGTAWKQTGPAVWHLAAYLTLQDLSGGATAELRKYREKLNLVEVPLGTPLEKTNKMYYCYGPKEDCLPDADLLDRPCDSWLEGLFYSVHRWWVRIDAPDGSSKVFCVTRRSHPGYNWSIPATARWRWILDDDSVWTECVNGCCQTGGA